MNSSGSSSSIKRVAITGGSGRVGQRIIRFLTNAGFDIVNLDRKTPPADLPGKFVFCDVRRRELVQPVFETVDAVIHMGEIPNSHQPFPMEEIFFSNTTCGSVVFQTAADLKVQKVLYISTCQVYGMWGMDKPEVIPQRLPFDETHPVAPRNVYGLSKVCNEQYAQLMNTCNGLNIAAFRIPGVWSDPPQDWHWGRFEDQNFRPRDGMGTHVFADDVARALQLALEKPLKPTFEVYNLAANEVWSYLPLAKLLELEHPNFPKLPSDWPAYKSPLLTDKARQHFGWEPTMSVLQFYRQRTGKRLPGDG